MHAIAACISANASNSLRGSVGSLQRSQNFFNPGFKQTRFLVGRKPHAHALGAIAGCPGRCDPCHLASDRVALNIIGQRQQHVNVSAEFVLMHRGNENAALLEQRNVSRIERRLVFHR